MYKKAFCLLCVLCLLSVCLCGCNVLGADVTGTTGTVERYGDYIYYINGIGSAPSQSYMYNVMMGALCRMKPDGTDRQIIVPMCVANFQLAGQEIYLVTADPDGSYIIGVCNLDGSGYTRLKAMSAGTFQYMGGYLYYQTENGLVRTDSRCNNITVLDSRAPTSTSYLNGAIFCTFADENTGKAGMERLALDGSERRVISDSECYIMGKDENGIYYVCRDDMVLYYYSDITRESEGMIYTSYDIYYIDGQTHTAFCAGGENEPGLWKLDMNGGKHRMTDDYCEDIIVTDKYVYYVNGSDCEFLYRIDRETDERRLVTACVPLAGSISVLDGYVYYVSPNERSRIFRIDERTLERVSIFCER